MTDDCWSAWSDRLTVFTTAILCLLLAGTARSEISENAPRPLEDAAPGNSSNEAPHMTIPRSGKAMKAELGADSASQPPSYETRLLEEASSGEATIATPDIQLGAGEAARHAASQTGNTSHGRIDEIKAAVSEALTESQRMAPLALDESREPPQAKVSADSRRELLQELVVHTPVPEDALDADYVRELHKEVAETLVLSEAVSPKPEKPPLAGIHSEGKIPPGVYRVQPGDSLWKIAKGQLGDAYRWPDIYEANRSALGGSHVLRIGQLLTLPN